MELELKQATSELFSFTVGYVAVAWLLGVSSIMNPVFVFGWFFGSWRLLNAQVPRKDAAAQPDRKPEENRLLDFALSLAIYIVILLGVAVAANMLGFPVVSVISGK